MTSTTQGRRPTGPGWYWYTGRVRNAIDFHERTYDIQSDVEQPVWVQTGEDVYIPGWQKADGWKFLSDYATPSDMPGDFVPLTKPVADVSQLSDGYHTFAELYEHRHTLWAALLYAYAPLAFKTRRNQDGEEWPGWFIAGMNTPMGQLSYHMPAEWWDRLPNIRELERNDKYDGHTSTDVLRRISTLRDCYRHPDPNPWALVDAELTKPATVPPPLWDDAPDWATGHQYGASGDGIWTAAGRSELSGLKLPLGVDWRTTLRKRPEVSGE